MPRAGKRAALPGMEDDFNGHVENEVRRRETFAILALAALISLASLDKAFHIDEPWFLAVARQILIDPWHPEGFSYNWLGEAVSVARVNTTPSYVFVYPLALAMKLVGDSEWKLRLCFLPFDLIAGYFLYRIAARYLRKPFWPMAIVLAGPAYAINIPHLMCEKMIAAFGFGAIYGLIRGTQDRRPRWLWASAAAAGAALMVKYSAVFLLLVAAGYGLLRRVPLKNLAAYFALALSPVAAYIGWGAVFVPARISAVASLLHFGYDVPTAAPICRLRSLLSFFGGCSVAALIWPWIAFSGDRRRFLYLAVIAAVAGILFLPVFDGQQVVGIDRALGIIFSAGALGMMGGVVLFRSKIHGWELWIPWLAAIVFLQGAVYESVVSRYVLFGIPPMIFAMSTVLEKRLRPLSLNYLYAGTFTLAAALSASLLWVDCRYAAAQSRIADIVRSDYIDAGKNAWFSGHWGLQYYMERAGARALDRSRGGWDEVKAGDITVMPYMNTGIIEPSHPIRGRVRGEFRIRHPVPLRLMMMGNRQAGFYSSGDGFLPFTWSDEPLDRFLIVERAD